MAKLAKPLSDKALKALKATGKNVTLYDGQGLQIVATIYGKKTWRFVYTFDGKKKTITLGNYPDISLALARELASQKRALLAQGIDPQEHAKEQRRERERNITVKELAILWHTKRTVRKAIKEETARKEFRRLELHLFPYFGEWHISEMTCKKVAQIFLDFPQSNTLYKVNNSLVQMFDFAEVEEIVVKNPLKRLHSFFDYDDSKQQPTITPQELPKLFRTIFYADKMTKITQLLIEWQLLTMLRPKEASSLKWSDIDWENLKIVIPAERMKAKRAHDVPLSKQALQILEEMKRFKHSIYIFPTQIAPYNKPINSQTANNALKRIGYKNKLVSHGFRSIASTYLHDLDQYSAQAIELCLAHDSRSKVQKSYDNSKKYAQRQKIMQAWGDFVEKCKIEALKA